MSPLPLIADVAVDAPGRDSYSYLVPDTLATGVTPGCCVLVPFGRRNERGFVLSVERREAPQGFALKAIADLREGVVLPAHLLSLIRWGAGYYRCPIGTFLAAAVPAPVREGTRIKTERWLRKVPGYAGELTARQQTVLAELPGEPIEFATALRLVQCTRGTIDRMVAAGALALVEQQEVREVTLESEEAHHPLNEEQQVAYDAIAGAIDGDAGDPFLLYGVTGSGKTLVYMQLVEQVLAQDPRPPTHSAFRRAIGNLIIAIGPSFANFQYDRYIIFYAF